MRKLSALRFAAFVVALLACYAPAQASFHLWQVNEIYSSANGALQYVELTDNFDFENFIAGHNIIASGGGPNRTFTFPGNLASTSTAGKTLLIATSNFQAITGVTPDYTLGANFLSLGGGAVTFDGSGSNIAYLAGALTGANALGPGAISQTPTPRNFAGQVATIPVPEPAAATLAATALLLVARKRTRRVRPASRA